MANFLGIQTSNDEYAVINGKFYRLGGEKGADLGEGLFAGARTKGKPFVYKGQVYTEVENPDNLDKAEKANALRDRNYANVDLKTETTTGIAQDVGQKVGIASKVPKKETTDDDIIKTIREHMDMPWEQRMQQYREIYDATVAASRGQLEGLSSAGQQSRMIGGSGYLRKAAQLNADIAAKAKGQQALAAQQDLGTWSNLWNAMQGRNLRMDEIKMQIASQEGMADKNRAFSTIMNAVQAGGQLGGAYMMYKGMQNKPQTEFDGPPPSGLPFIPPDQSQLSWMQPMPTSVDTYGIPGVSDTGSVKFGQSTVPGTSFSGLPYDPSLVSMTPTSGVKTSYGETSYPTTDNEYAYSSD